jgi:hypothetical protein
MSQKEEINAALAAHAQWKKRLQEAIEKTESEFKVEIVKKDNECQFGRWLYGLPSATKDNPEYQNIIALHAEFHKIASEILALALNGNKTEALKKLEFGGAYSSISGKLVIALRQLEKK